jgi:hypothetical protein
MSVSQRFRMAVQDRESGAVAIVVALSSVVLFGVSALVIDIGQAYAQRRASQEQADLAALAGATALPDTATAFTRAYDYLKDNLPTAQAAALVAVNSPVWKDGNEANGEIAFSAGNTRIRVVVPDQRVDFGFANALPGGGYSNTHVRASATAEIRSPASSLPFSLAEGADSGFTCLKDASGCAAKSAMRAVLLPAAAPTKPPSVTNATPGTVANPLAVAGSEQIVVTGTNFDNPAPTVSSVMIGSTPVAYTVNSAKQLTVTASPAHAAGNVTMVVKNGDAPDATFNLTYALRVPSVSVTSPGSAATPLSTVGGQSMTVTGDNFTSPAPLVSTVKIDGVNVPSFTVNSKTQLTVTTPAHAAGTAQLLVTNADGNSTPFTVNYTAPPAPPLPTVTGLSPASGPSIGGTVVTITGTNFASAASLVGVTFGPGTAALSFTWVDTTHVRATSPAGSGAVDVQVTTTAGTSTTNANDVYTYEIDSCAGATGNFGFLDIPRSKAPAPNGANDLVTANIAAGVDHGWSTFPSVSTVPIGTECDKPLLTGAILDNGNGVEGANCLDVENGNKTGDVANGFLDGYTKSPTVKARLATTDSAHHPGTIDGRTGLDRDSITNYLAAGVTLQMFTNALASGSVTPGWLKSDIVGCPRFAIVPVLHVNGAFGNGYYPITRFRGVFVDSPAPEYGFVPKGGGSQIQAVKAYAFSLDFLPGIISDSDVGGTVKFLGSGPKIPVLVHDDADPSY